MKKQKILLKKVCVHNLKGVDLSLSPGELIVFSGVSGSGKSSLAFDTIYVEGQRRYIESLSHQARRFLHEMPKPQAEGIFGLSPTIAIEQKLSSRTPRSTVGTLTGIYDFLRVLFARLAVPYCPISQEPVTAQSREKMIATLQALAPKTPILFLAPYAKNKKGECKEDLMHLLARGYLRVRVDGDFLDLNDTQALNPQASHDIDVVIDRLVVEPENFSRIAEAVHAALEMGEGFFSVYFNKTGEETSFSQFAYSQKSELSYGPLEPSDFSFNHPAGMCPQCQGLGRCAEFDLSLILDPEKSICEDCFKIGSSYQTIRYKNIYNNLARIYRFNVKTPWKKIPSQAQQVLLYGSDQKWLRMEFSHPEKKTRWTEFVSWKGVLAEAKERLNAAQSDVYRKKMRAFMVEGTCPSCQGARIQPYPAAARFKEKTIAEITSLTLEEAGQFFQNLSLSDIEKPIGEELVKEIGQRLQFLLNVGLSYLTLDRTAPTLSGGESQRVRLASQIGAGLVGAIYVLDEPSIGLHPSDHHKLIDTLLHLRDQGNTVLVVEHDRDTMQAADTIVDVGPGAGKEGGKILFQGPYSRILSNTHSLTGAYLSGKKTFPVPSLRKEASGSLRILGATHHNLKGVDVTLPLGVLCCVTGVSGSGKSSLISDVLFPALSKHFHSAQTPIGAHQRIEGIEQIDKVIAMDQSPIGRTPRSNAATYIKLFDDIRDLFAKLPESQMRGFTPGHFSFNVKEGSCSYCSGMGQVRMDMDFMEDAWSVCPQCEGKRFDPEILSVQFKGHSIYDILEMDVKSALALFEAIPTLCHKLQLLCLVGLHYLPIGQSSTTLSGGEAQRIKLAKELVRPSTHRTLYILDEPTTGLHFQDICHLLSVLQKLVDQGNSVLVIEHNMDFAKCADWIIEMGPGPGVYGGRLIAEGTPEQVSQQNTPTGLALFEALCPKQKKRSASKKRPTAPVLPSLWVKGACQNNLRSVSLSVPRGKISVFTGPSGSGKSSLAFETFYAEGQRRYTETLSSYARSQLKQLPKPKVEQIGGLSPSIALEQKTGGLNPRSTVGTLTEVYDLLRILYAHLGTAYSPETGQLICHISKPFIVQKVLSLPLKEKVQILAPIELQKKETFSEMLERWNRQGYLRIRLNQIIYEIDEEIPFESAKKNQICLVIDRLQVDPKNEKRLYEAIERADQIGCGKLFVARETEDLFFNLAFADPTTGTSFPPLTPQTFSFNHHEGMCLECQGLGFVYGAQLLEEKTILSRSILDILDLLWKEKGQKKAFARVLEYFKQRGIPINLPLKKLSPSALQLFLEGDKTSQGKKKLKLQWKGLQPVLALAMRMGKKESKEALASFLKTACCLACEGTRLNPLARHVRIQKTSLPDLCRMSLDQTLCWIKNLSLEKGHFLQETCLHIEKYLHFLLSIGLGYLSLDRSAPTLSGGELQRLRLARQLGSGLTGCLYILDEPTIGLHPANNERLNAALRSLCDLGNTLILVEHDPLTIEQADYLFDFGPGAGKQGGKVIAEGTLQEIIKNPDSLTGAYLSGRKSIPLPLKRRQGTGEIRIEQATLHNLKNLSLSIPKGAITCVTGVSGSGKSSLIRHLLLPAARAALKHSRKAKDSVLHHQTRFQGLGSFEQVISLDQSPIGLTARADVSTYSEIQPLIRTLLASLPLATMKGLKPGHFSPNHIRGMCRTCWGLGYQTIDLQFMPSVRVVCESCRGNKLHSVALEVRYKGKHFGDLLKLSIQEALDWFSTIPRIAKKLKSLIAVGLGYLQLGQELASLSGGEAQRLRLARELARRETGKTLYLFDEPSTGLHSSDIAQLVPIFHSLADKKNTLILIEHNLDLMMQSDYLIDLGPDAGDQGGELLATGTPEEVSKHPRSLTGAYLAKYLKMSYTQP